METVLHQFTGIFIFPGRAGFNLMSGRNKFFCWQKPNPGIGSNM